LKTCYLSMLLTRLQQLELHIQSIRSLSLQHLCQLTSLTKLVLVSNRPDNLVPEFLRCSHWQHCARCWVSECVLRNLELVMAVGRKLSSLRLVDRKPQPPGLGLLRSSPRECCI
jgi:hypothetical protein